MSTTSEPLHFFRIEHNTRRIGPYNFMKKYKGVYTGWSNRACICHIVRHETGQELFCNQGHLPPSQDKLGSFIDKSVRDGFRFGFSSLEQLKAWFSDNPAVYKSLKKHKMVLRRFDVMERWDGDTQSVARKKELKKGLTIPFEELF